MEKKEKIPRFPNNVVENYLHVHLSNSVNNISIFSNDISFLLGLVGCVSTYLVVLWVAERGTCSGRHSSRRSGGRLAFHHSVHFSRFLTI